MPRKSTVPSPDQADQPRASAPPPVMSAAVEQDDPLPEAGEYLITIAEGAEVAALSAFEDAAGIHGMASTASMSPDDIATEGLAEEGKGLILARVGVAAARLDPDQVKSLRAHNGHTFVAVEAAPVFFALGALSEDYLRGYRDCIESLLRHLEPEFRPPLGSVTPIEGAQVEDDVTWGLRLTRVPDSRWTGAGIRVAVLDTGLDLSHPDFSGRRLVHQSFIPGEETQDQHGHGTHCVGTACGPRKPTLGPRYGIASDAEIYVGKVLSNTGGGSRGRSVELGMEWALANRCHVISLSLGAPTMVGSRPYFAYERIGSRALAAGSLMVAAAGNESIRRRGIVNPVGSPANCQSFMAVGAIDSGLNIADFTNAGLNPGGGEVNLAGPGVGVYSSIPPRSYGLKNGTSMATPHVAGIAALWAQASGRTGQALWDAMIEAVRPLPHAARDVGRGLVQAPPGGSC